ncbi:MAG: porin [Paracoccaceae bacterium]
MKNLLLSSSALALIGLYAAPANAAEWEVVVGGGSTQQFGYAGVDIDGLSDDEADFDGVDVLSDTEIEFTPSITLDNGIQFGLNVQLEGNTGGDQIDESFAFVEGAFGRVNIGSENSAGYLMTFAAPCVALNCHNSGSLTGFVPYSGTPDGTGVELGADAFRGTLGATFLENARNNDAQRVTYFTPRFGGVQLGVSYARDDLQDSSAPVNLGDDTGTVGDFVDVGANYVNSFGSFDVAVSARYGIAFTDGSGEDEFSLDLDDDEGEDGIFDSNLDNNPQVFAFGANFGFAGVTIGGSWGEQNNAGADDGTVYDVGISYETGPWGVSFSYLHGENVDDGLFTPAFADTDDDGIDEVISFQPGADEELDKFVLGINYTLASGVDLGVFGAYVDFEEDFGDGSIIGVSETDGDAIDGFVVGTGFSLSF